MKAIKLSTIITAFANFGVTYNYNSITIALIVMSESVCTNGSSNCALGIQASWVNSSTEAVIFVGTIMGQLTMGYLGDVIGRSRALFATSFLAFISALLSGIVPSGSPNNIYAVIIIFRFFLGLGLGGVFPLSATKASEDSAKELGKEIDPLASSWAFFWQMVRLPLLYLMYAIE